MHVRKRSFHRNRNIKLTKLQVKYHKTRDRNYGLGTEALCELCPKTSIYNLWLHYAVCVLQYHVDNCISNAQIKVARYNNFVATPSIFESLVLTQIELYGKTILTDVLHRLEFIMILFFGRLRANDVMIFSYFSYCFLPFYNFITFRKAVTEGNQARQILACCMGIWGCAKLEATGNCKAKIIQIYHISSIFTQLCAYVRQFKMFQ